RWPASQTVVYRGALTNRETVDALADHDVFVLPTRHEGLPVGLVEAMGAGLVPIVSDIESGVPDVVTAGINGLMPGVADIDGFAAAITRLASARTLLETMSAAARRTIEERFDIRERVADY